MPLPPPGSDVAAVYLTLHNPGNAPQVIIGVESPLARSAMLHQSTVVGGTARMRPIPRLPIAAGQTLVLAPEGLHIMLAGLRQRVQIGQDVPLVLILADRRKIDARVRVRPTGSG
jgi:periplasmic copper chaperone A